VGLANPGTVVDKLDPSKFMGVAQVARANLRGLSLSNSRGIVRDALRLPGVVNEVNSLKKIMKGTQLLDSKFTVKGFSNEVSTGSYRILHIASHGIFGGDASSSFILASDDVLSINGLQSILLSDNLKRSPIDLLTLSACETAEGNDRAPLGFSGAAIKARARSVLGTLWPVVDDAAKQVMADFYQEFVGNHSGKAVSLRKAQTALLKNPETAHPFFWAPFTLIGNWL
jgi:CHAT domain-containing protein